MIKEIREYMEIYNTCHWIKPVKHKPYGKFDFLDTLRAPFTDLTMDFIMDMLKCKHHQVVYNLVIFIINRYTKMASYIASHME